MEDMYYKPTYKCGICGKEHPSIAERMKCEQACLKKKEEEEKQAIEAKKKAEKDARAAEVTQAIEHAAELLNKYINDFGSYSYDGKKLNDTSDYFWPSRLWHYFL
ncbi:MAG: hypothetical protein ACI4XN_13730 [Candidatus Kurthia intestinigallinarum]